MQCSLLSMKLVPGVASAKAISDRSSLPLGDREGEDAVWVKNKKEFHNSFYLVSKMEEYEIAKKKKDYKIKHEIKLMTFIYEG